MSIYAFLTVSHFLEALPTEKKEMMHTWCAEQIPFSLRHVNRISPEKRGEGVLESGLADRQKKKHVQGSESSWVELEPRSPAQTFDHFAFMSSIQAFSFYRTPRCVFSVSWNTHRCAAACMLTIHNRTSSKLSRICLSHLQKCNKICLPGRASLSLYYIMSYSREDAELRSVRVYFKNATFNGWIFICLVSLLILRMLGWRVTELHPFSWECNKRKTIVFKVVSKYRPFFFIYFIKLLFFKLSY